MKYKRLGRSEIKMSAIVMGTWQAGKTGFRGKSQWLGIDDLEITKALLMALEMGVNSFDSALIYGEGDSEKIIGKTLGSQRDKVILTSKTHPLQWGYDQVINSCHLSLKNFGSDYIDLYQVHFPPHFFDSEKSDPDAIENCMRALNKLKEEGKIRAIGVSNFSLKELEEAMTFSQIDSLQMAYSLLWPQAEKELIPFCEKHDISFLSYSPLAQSLLTGRITELSQIKEGDNRKQNILFREPTFQKAIDAINEMKALADKKQIELSQLALAWVIKNNQVLAISGLRNSEQLVSNAKAADVVLTKSEMDELNRIVDVFSYGLDDNPMMWRS